MSGLGALSTTTSNFSRSTNTYTITKDGIHIVAPALTTTNFPMHPTLAGQSAIFYTYTQGYGSWYVYSWTFVFIASNGVNYFPNGAIVNGTTMSLTGSYSTSMGSTGVVCACIELKS